MQTHRNIQKCKYIEIKIDDAVVIIKNKQNSKNKNILHIIRPTKYRHIYKILRLTTNKSINKNTK